jgi:hypothetical protein
MACAGCQARGAMIGSAVKAARAGAPRRALGELSPLPASLAADAKAAVQSAAAAVLARIRG